MNRNTVIIISAVILIVGLEACAVGVCRDLLGNVTVLGELFYYVLIPNIVALFLFFKPARRNFSKLIFAVTALSVIPLYIGERVSANRLQAEISGLVAFVDQTKKATGKLPADIAQYPKWDALLAQHIRSYDPRGEAYTIHYFCTRQAIANWYDSDSGWGHGND